jgi:hypothetical protein
MTHEHPLHAGPPGRVFVGRKPELAELRAGLDRALAGRGSVIGMRLPRAAAAAEISPGVLDERLNRRRASPLVSPGSSCSISSLTRSFS